MEGAASSVRGLPAYLSKRKLLDRDFQCHKGHWKLGHVSSAHLPHWDLAVRYEVQSDESGTTEFYLSACRIYLE